MDTVRKHKSGDQLAAGDWLAPGELHNLPTEIAWTNVYQVGGEHHVQVLHRPMGETGKALGDVLSATGLFDLATEDELAGLREQADRARKIADARAMLDWLERTPEVPLPYSFGIQVSPGLDTLDHLDVWNSGAEGLAALERWAEAMGEPVRKVNAKQTHVTKTFGGTEYRVVAHHKDGRPAEPAPESADPIGFDHSRPADGDEPQQIGQRVEPHVGGVTDEGLVDETPEGEPVHYRFGMNDTACGLKPGNVPQASAEHSQVTCRPCLFEIA